MNEERFNTSLRSFLKMVGINSQREIEAAVKKAIDEGKLKGTETIPVHMTLNIPDLGVNVTLDDKIRLE